MQPEEVRAQIKRQLHDYRNICREIAQIERMTEQLEAAMTAPKAQIMTGMPRSGGSGDPIAEQVARMIELQEKYETKRVELLAAQDAVETLIEGLDSLERRIFRLHYIDGLIWERVCVEIGYSWRRTHEYHSKALDKLVEMELAKMVE